jgi:dihydroxyacid dehydratase/phosphogluconate dehydratase
MIPGGRYAAADLFEAGGLSLVTRELLKKGLIDGSTPNVDGGTIASAAAATVETEGQKVVVPIEAPLKATGGLTILHGSLAPTAASSSWPATSAASTRARPASSRTRTPATRPSETRRSTRAT